MTRMTQAALSRRPRKPMPSDDRDQVLLQRLAGGDSKAFDEIVADHHAAVARLVYRLLAWDDEADDVVQEVFLAAWRHWPRFRGEATLATWLRRIAVNQCRVRQRKWRLRADWWQWIRRTPPPMDCSGADQPVLDRERFQRVRAAVRALPQRDREVIALHYLEQLSIDEISAELQLKRNAVEVRLHRARQRLKPLLAELQEE